MLCFYGRIIKLLSLQDKDRMSIGCSIIGQTSCFCNTVEDNVFMAGGISWSRGEETDCVNE